MTGGDTPLGRAVFGALVVACFGAFFVTQRLKHTPTVVQRVMMTSYFVPIPGSPHALERISFRIAKADHVTVTVIDSAGDQVATLMAGAPVKRYTQTRLFWNGHRDAGGVPEAGPVAAPGAYRLRFSLRDQNRTLNSPRSFTLTLIPPAHHPASASP